MTDDQAFGRASQRTDLDGRRPSPEGAAGLHTRKRNHDTTATAPEPRSPGSPSPGGPPGRCGSSGADGANGADGLAVWIVETETATYLWDRAASTVTRSPGGAGSIDGVPVLIASLRRDGNAIDVVEAEAPVVGRSWRLVLAILLDGVLTVRQTTAVCSIRRVT